MKIVEVFFGLQCIISNMKQPVSSGVFNLLCTSIIIFVCRCWCSNIV